MLELESITWKNFLSYGDYETSVRLDNLGQCLIIGEINDDNKQTLNKSNGAGKSTIPSVIQWVLFGRTMHSRNPGNNVINWFTGKDCWAELKFKNGDSIIRTRNTDGKNELLISRDGEESKFNSDTLSTSANQQASLNKIFGLDWEVFCGSVFFNQYGKPWMEMADATRKKAIERVLHVDRFTYYSQVAKSKCDMIDKLVHRHRSTIDTLRANLTQLHSEAERLSAASGSFGQSRERRIQDIRLQINSCIKARKELQLPDLDKLQKLWDIIGKIKIKISELQDKLLSIKTKKAQISGKINNLNSTINNWKSKSGKICISCEQDIPSGHIASKIQPVIDEKKALESELSLVHEEESALTAKIRDIEHNLSSNTPSMSMNEAQHILNRYRQYEADVVKLELQIDKISKEENPHDTSIAQVNNRISDTTTKIAALEKELERDNLLNSHYHYVHKAYNDRNKIKGLIFREHIPFINSRLRHYLDVFDLDIKIELTDSLGISSSMWGYDFESGGERKRTDVAFMLAMFDFHEQMYGRQCNVLVLDEVDGRLDDDGIDSLIRIIKDDLAHRVETIFIISHRNMMSDVFSKEIRVVRNGRFSSLES